MRRNEQEQPSKEESLPYICTVQCRDLTPLQAQLTRLRWLDRELDFCNLSFPLRRIDFSVATVVRGAAIDPLTLSIGHVTYTHSSVQVRPSRLRLHMYRCCTASTYVELSGWLSVFLAITLPFKYVIEETRAVWSTCNWGSGGVLTRRRTWRHPFVRCCLPRMTSRKPPPNGVQG